MPPSGGPLRGAEIAMAQNSRRKARLAHIMGELEKKGIPQMLVTDPASIEWLYGFGINPGERFYGLLLRSNAEPLLLVNDLFPTPSDLEVEVRGFRDTDDPIDLLASLIDPEAPLGVDKFMAAHFLLPLRDRGAASDFVLGSFAVDGARSIKDAEEIELMRRASAVNDHAMEWLLSQVHEGVTEAQIANALLDEYKRLGAQGFSFDPIISFGAHAADPHHEPDDTALMPGDVVLFDVGCVLDGYCSDMTRTFFFKSCSDEQRSVYETVCAANEAAAAVVAPGVLFSDIDRTARDIIEKAGYGREFTHRLGHQIGTNVHEPGDVSATHHEPVQPGMCFSDEPGIYLPERFGVRIEDLIVVTEEGHEVLNKFPHDLVIVE